MLAANSSDTSGSSRYSHAWTLVLHDGTRSASPSGMTRPVAMRSRRAATVRTPTSSQSAATVQSSLVTAMSASWAARTPALYATATLRALLATRRMPSDGSSAISAVTASPRLWSTSTISAGSAVPAATERRQSRSNAVRPIVGITRLTGRRRLTASRLDRPAQLRPHRRPQPVVGLPLGRSDAEAHRFLDQVPVVTRVDVDADEVVVRPQDARKSDRHLGFAGRAAEP